MYVYIYIYIYMLFGNTSRNTSTIPCVLETELVSSKGTSLQPPPPRGGASACLLQSSRAPPEPNFGAFGPRAAIQRELRGSQGMGGRKEQLV